MFLQSKRLRRGFNAVNGLPSVALRCRRMQPAVTALLITYMQTLCEPGSSGPVSVAMRGVLPQAAWMSSWLEEFDRLQSSTAAGQPRSQARQLDTFMDPAGEVMSHHGSDQGDFDNLDLGDLDRLSSFDSDDDVATHGFDV